MYEFTLAQTQGPQGTVSTVVLEDEKILAALKELRDLLSRYAPQLLNVFKIKNPLTLVAENFFSEMRAGSYNMPYQLQFDFRFSREGPIIKTALINIQAIQGRPGRLSMNLHHVNLAKQQ